MGQSSIDGFAPIIATERPADRSDRTAKSSMIARKAVVVDLWGQDL